MVPVRVFSTSTTITNARNGIILSKKYACVLLCLCRHPENEWRREIDLVTRAVYYINLIIGDVQFKPPYAAFPGIQHVPSHHIPPARPVAQPLPNAAITELFGFQPQLAASAGRSFERAQQTSEKRADDSGSKHA
jgi:hypothetical protein